MSEKKRRWHHRYLFPGSRPALLLVSLFLLLATYPWFEQRSFGANQNSHEQASLVLHVFFTMILFGGAWLVHDRPRTFLIASILGGPWVVMGWLDHFMDFSDAVEGGTTCFFAACALYVALSQLGFVLRAKKVTTDVLCRAVSVYLLIGVAWMAMYSSVALFVSHAFSADPNICHGLNGQIGWSDFLYYSFSTLSTLGPGDIIPVSSYARSLAILECVIGPLYLAVLLARLVAMYGKER